MRTAVDFLENEVDVQCAIDCSTRQSKSAYSLVLQHKRRYVFGCWVVMMRSGVRIVAGKHRKCVVAVRCGGSGSSDIDADSGSQISSCDRRVRGITCSTRWYWRISCNNNSSSSSRTLVQGNAGGSDTEAGCKSVTILKGTAAQHVCAHLPRVEGGLQGRCRREGPRRGARGPGDRQRMWQNNAA